MFFEGCVCCKFSTPWASEGFANGLANIDWLKVNSRITIMVFIMAPHSNSYDRNHSLKFEPIQILVRSCSVSVHEIESPSRGGESDICHSYA